MGPNPSGNQRLWIGGRDILIVQILCPAPLALKTWDKVFVKCQKEVPSARQWLTEPPMNIPSISSITWSVNNDMVLQY